MPASLTTLATNVAVKVVASGLFRGLTWVYQKLKLSQAPTFISSLTSAIFLCVGATVILWATALHSVSVLTAAAFLFFLGALGISDYAWPLFRLKAIGVIGADFEIRTGTDYGRVLSICNNDLAFLGIGAAKLTSEETFEAAILRCQANRPPRFLLCDPESQALADSARQAGKDRDEYRDRVRESLRRIAQLRERRAAKIEVRFYKDNPETFRLVFIDNHLCLVSYNALGEGDGSQLPQLHIRAYHDAREVSTFYWAFRTYFERLWGNATPWDSTKYL